MKTLEFEKMNLCEMDFNETQFVNGGAACAQSVFGYCLCGAAAAVASVGDYLEAGLKRGWNTFQL